MTDYQFQKLLDWEKNPNKTNTIGGINLFKYTDEISSRIRCPYRIRDIVTGGAWNTSQPSIIGVPLKVVRTCDWGVIVTLYSCSLPEGHKEKIEAYFNACAFRNWARYKPFNLE